MRTTARGLAPSLTMWPTARGLGALVALAFAFVMAWQYGLRALHAIMIPLAVGVVAAVITTARVERPDVRRPPIEDGFIGERRTVEIAIDADRSIAATVHDAVGDGLSPVDGGNVEETILQSGSSVTYEVELERRGEHPLGPLTITVTDLLGLVRRRIEDDRTTAAIVFPHVYDLRNGDERDLRALTNVVDVAEREEFDHLREYTRSDSMRHVHWKSAAKRADDELVIKEFENEVDRGATTVAAECSPGGDDGMATAAASVVTYLLRTGVSVGLALPDEAHPPSSGREHHRELLGSLAVAGSGELDARTRDRADVVVRADDSGVVVVVDGVEIPFDRLRGANPDGTDRERPRNVSGDRARRTEQDGRPDRSAAERGSSGERSRARETDSGVNA